MKKFFLVLASIFFGYAVAKNVETEKEAVKICEDCGYPLDDYHPRKSCYE